MSAIFYVLRTGCQWNALPRSLGASSTVHDRFQEWRSAGVFKSMWIDGLSAYDKKTGIDWKTHDVITSVVSITVSKNIWEMFLTAGALTNGDQRQRLI